MFQEIVGFINRYLSPAAATALSQAGTTLVTDTAAHDGRWWKFSVVGTVPAVFDVLTDDARDGNTLSSLSVAVGQTLEGQITSVKLASGQIYLSKYDTKRWWQIWRQW